MMPSLEYHDRLSTNTNRRRHYPLVKTTSYKIWINSLSQKERIRVKKKKKKERSFLVTYKGYCSHLCQLMSYKGASFESFWKTWNFISAATSVKHCSYIKDVKVPRNELEKNV